MNTQFWIHALRTLTAVTFLLILPGSPETSPAGSYAAMPDARPAQASTPPREVAFVEVKKNGVADTEGLGRVWSLALSPDGSFVYAAGFRDSMVAVFRRDKTSGKLAFVEAVRDGTDGIDGLAGVCAVAISPDGRNLYAAGHWDHAIAVFGRETTTGRLSFMEVQREGTLGVKGLNVVQAVTVSPDGRQVYTAAYRSYGVAVFSRAETTGTLSFVEVQSEGTGGVEGLRGASAVSVSPDGLNLYATGYFGSAVVVFQRDRYSGKLDFFEALRDGIGEVTGIQGPCAVKVSPDAKQVYVVSSVDSAIAVFARDSVRGTLTFLEAHRDGRDGVEGLSATQGLAVAPDGKRVYTTGWGDNALVVFGRDEASGRLIFEGVLRDDSDDIDGLRGAASVEVSPEGTHIYIAGSSEQAIAVFSAGSD